MNDLQIFENSEFGSVRTITVDGEPYFVGIDVADKLEYQNGSRDINAHIDEIQQHVKRRVVNILGGKQSEAYRDNSIRHKTFSDIWTQLKREYGCVSTYKSIKRKYIDDVHEFIDCYVVPKYLDELIHDANAQQSFA